MSQITFDYVMNAVLKKHYEFEKETGRKPKLSIYIDRDSLLNLKTTLPREWEAKELCENNSIFGYKVFTVLSDLRHFKIYVE